MFKLSHHIYEIHGHQYAQMHLSINNLDVQDLLQQLQPGPNAKAEGMHSIDFVTLSFKWNITKLMQTSHDPYA